MEKPKRKGSIAKNFVILLVFFAAGVLVDKFYSRAKVTKVKVWPIQEDGVDIVITVHNALAELKDTLATVRTFTLQPYHVYIIDDRSEAPTSLWIKKYRSTNAATVSAYSLNDPLSVGYTHAVNLGISKGRYPYVLILNSDTILPQNWFDNMKKCMKSVPECSIVGPLSNAGSVQSVPAIKEKVMGANGKMVTRWSKNELPTGWTPLGMSKAVNKLSDRVYPIVPFLNGFCMLARREMFNKVGLFNAKSFPYGYGEENDFMLRARKLGFVAAVDDSTYVYHHKTRSFSDEERTEQSKEGSRQLSLLHSEFTVRKLSKHFSKKMETLNPLRDRLNFAMKFPELFQGPSLRILFLLPSSSTGGGSTSVVMEAIEMERLGITVRIALWDKSFPAFISAYPEARNMFVPLPKSGKDVEPIKHFMRYGTLFDIVISTVWVSVYLMYDMYNLFPNFLPAYYIQDYEPDFFHAQQDKNRIRCLESYNKAAEINSVMYAKSSWLANKVSREHNVHVHVVPAAIEDMDCQDATSQQKSPHTVRIVAMLRPATPRRNAENTYTSLRSIKFALGSKIEVFTFGCEARELSKMKEKSERESNDDSTFEYTHMGVFNRSEVSDLYKKTDVFLDLSVWQAYGRSAAEAMTCGNTAVVTSAGGASEFVKHEYNGFLVDPANYESILSSIVDIAETRERLLLMQQRARAVREELRLQPAVSSRLALLKTKMAERFDGVTAGLSTRDSAGVYIS